MNFDEIHLLPKEKRSLFTFYFRLRQKSEEIRCFWTLYHKYRFIKQNYTNEYNKNGCPFSDGTYSISDQYRRYKIYRREKRIHDLPNWIAITISLIGLIGNTLIELWRLGLLQSPP